MAETVVHVTTLYQWKSVLDVWFKQGYAWRGGNGGYEEHIFENGGRFLFLDDYITWNASNYNSEPFIEYSEFMAQQKEDNKMETYYVTKEQLDLIESAKNLNYPLTGITAPENLQKEFDKTCFDNQKEILRYLGGDETIEFKVKDQLYRLWAIDDDGDKVYVDNYSLSAPATIDKNSAFTAPLEEIKKWQTPAWSVEEVD